MPLGLKLLATSNKDEALVLSWCQNINLHEELAMQKIVVAILISFFLTTQVVAKQSVVLHTISADGVGESVGVVTLDDSNYGLLLRPMLQGMPAGLHGFHIHANASCEPGVKNGERVAGLAAGGHFDPANTGKHLGPYNDAGHLGDLPAIYVANDGTATTTVLAPRLTLAQVKQHALMVHAGGDNFSDDPQPLGGGGARMYCGVIE